MKKLAWYRVPEVWLLIVLLAGGVGLAGYVDDDVGHDRLLG